MKRILGLTVLAAAAVATLFLGCPSDKSGIRIGVILPLTGGEFSSLGEDCKNGIALATEEFNKTSKVQVSLLFEDSQGRPETAVSAFNRLRAVGVDAVIGDLFSAPTLAIAPLAERHRLFTFSPGASNPNLSGASRYVFRNYPSDNYEGKLVAKYLRQEKGLVRVAVLYPNNDYGVGLRDVFVTSFTQLGGTTVLVEGYADNETAFRDVLAKVARADAEALYLPGYYGAIARIAVQAKQLGLSVPMFSNVAAEDPKILSIGGNAIEGLTYTAPAVDLESHDPMVRNFVAAYRGKYGTEPSFPAAHGYDTALILYSVMTSRGANADSIRAGILAGKFTGVTGSMTFDENGDVTKPFMIKTIKDGTFRVVGQTSF